MLFLLLTITIIVVFHSGVKKDANLSKSVERIVLGGQDQIIRYCRWNNDARLLMCGNTNTNANTNIPNCQYCNGPRKFEFQVMPQLLYYLNVDKDTKVSYQAQLASKIGMHIYTIVLDMTRFDYYYYYYHLYYYNTTKVILKMLQLHQKYSKIIN